MNGNSRPTFVLLIVLGTLAGCATGGQNKSEIDGEGTPAEAVSMEELLNEGNETLRAGDLDAAQVSFALAVEREPDNIDALYKLGVIHYEKDSLAIAESLLRKVLAIAEHHQGSREALGVVMLKQERLDEAEKVLLEALESRPDAWQVLNALGVINDMRSRHAEAQELFGAALFIVPRSAKVANNLGYSHYLSGDYDAAENQFRNATRFDRNYVHAWSNLALVYSRTGRYREARAAFDKIVETHQAANNLGYLGLLQDEPALAREELKRAISLSPSYYEVANENLAALSDLRPAGGIRPRAAREVGQRTGESPDAIPRLPIGGPATALRVAEQSVPSSGLTGRSASPPAVTRSANVAPSSSPRQRQRDARRDAAPMLAYTGFVSAKDDDRSLKATVRLFQKAHGLRADGLIGRRTGTMLHKVAVTRMQEQLLALGYAAGGVDGKLGRQTREAIRDFQRAESLNASGLPDAATLERLGTASARASGQPDEERPEQGSHG